MTNFECRMPNISSLVITSFLDSARNDRGNVSYKTSRCYRSRIVALHAKSEDKWVARAFREPPVQPRENHLSCSQDRQSIFAHGARADSKSPSRLRIWSGARAKRRESVCECHIDDKRDCSLGLDFVK